MATAQHTQLIRGLLEDIKAGRPINTSGDVQAALEAAAESLTTSSSQASTSSSKQESVQELEAKLTAARQRQASGASDVRPSPSLGDIASAPQHAQTPLSRTPDSAHATDSARSGDSTHAAADINAYTPAQSEQSSQQSHSKAPRNK